MVNEKPGVRSGKTSSVRTDLNDREFMTQNALAEIERIGQAAALKNCCELADRIAAKLTEAAVEDFEDRAAVVGLLAFLERAAAVLKKM
jgi:hypothetical protein